MMRRFSRPATISVAMLAALSGVLGVGCGRPEGLDVSTLPDFVRSDYAVFAQRCSKCHSLARPLTSGIDDDAYWVMYVAKMRRQPESGISQEDTVEILRFLHYFSVEQKAKKGAPPPEPASSTPAPSAAPSAFPSAAPAVPVGARARENRVF